MEYVYRFIGEEGEILYIGKTIHMYERMCQHFGRHEWPPKQVPKEHAKDIKKVEYTEIEKSSDAALLEAYLIMMHRPRYNNEWVMDEEPSFRLEYGTLEWKEWELRLEDNPHHHMFVWRRGDIPKHDVLLYEVPKTHEVFDALCRVLGIEADMNFMYGKAQYIGEYKIMRLTEKRHIRTGKETQRPKYSFMGYPEKRAV